MNFHSHAFTQTAPGWYRAAVLCWYVAGLAMVGFLIAAFLVKRLGSRSLGRVCAWGWSVSTVIFLVPMLVNSCTYLPL